MGISQLFIHFKKGFDFDKQQYNQQTNSCYYYYSKSIDSIKLLRQTIMALVAKFAISTTELSDGPATQATRVASSSSSLFVADGASICKLADENWSKSETVWQGNANIQSIQSTSSSSDELGIVAAADAVGNVMVTTNGQFTLRQKGTANESGWCGVTFNEVDKSLAVTFMWDRVSSVIDGAARFEHELPPLSLCGSKSKSGVFIITEWNDVTIWDVRAPRGGLVERLISNQIGGGGNGPLWASDTVGNNFCVGGEDRTVSLFDDRKMRVVDTWKTPLKHDIVGLKFVESTSGLLLSCVGLDHELCHWSSSLSSSSKIKKNQENDDDKLDDDDEQRRTNFGRLHHNHRIFRAKARWTGICTFKENGIIGRDSEGTLYKFVI